MSEAAALHEWQRRFELWHRDNVSGDGSHDAGHFRRVWQNCQRLAASETTPVNPRLLLAAAYFHDLVNPPKDSPDRARASHLSADAAQALLQHWLYPLTGDEYAELHHVIAAHSFSAALPATTFNAQLFQDADRLEALGAVGLARMFCVTGQMGRALWDQDDPLATSRPLDDKAFSIDHIEVKLRRVAGQMQTNTGRTMAAERMMFVDRFRDQLLAEIDF